MSAQFNDAAINAVFEKIEGYALSSGRFDTVGKHEPKNAPGNGLSAALWIQSIVPIRSSGAAATSGVVLFQFRIYTNFKQMPYDMIDPNVTAATTDLMGTLSADFDFGGVAGVRNIDLLGAYGVKMDAQAGYVDIDRSLFRVMTIRIPVVVNDMFVQVA